MTLTQSRTESHRMRLFWVSLAIAGLALILSILSLIRVVPTSDSSEHIRPDEPISALEQVRKTRVIRVGYGGFPPYTIIDPKEADPNNQVSGFVPDLINEIASRAEPPLKVQWHRLNWTTLRADMASDRFDFLADAVYMTIPKALDFAFTDPFGYFGIGAAVVGIDDDRFKTFDDLDRDDIVIALAQGYVTTDYARARLTKPAFKIIPIDSDAFVQLDEVLAGRADVALNDVPTVVQYVRAHSGRVKALWVDSPPSTVPAGFMMNNGQPELLRFLNSSLEVLRADGTLVRVDEKWNSLGHFLDRKFRPGAGLIVD